MPLTPDQQATALGILLDNRGDDGALDSFVPGLTTADLVPNIVTALGSNFDDTLTTCLNSFVVQQQAIIDATQQALADMQKQVTEATVPNTNPLPPVPAPPAGP
jgi:hypothetical protein